MKRIFICVFTLLLAFLLIACGKKNTITFESNEGSAVATIEAKAGDKIVKPADPTLADMTFGGWYSDIELTEAYAFPETMPEESIKLYAKWIVTLHFDTKGAGTIPDIVDESGKFFKAPASPVKDGYVFVGWYMDEAYTTPLVTVMPSKNATAYARWQVYETGSAITLSDNWTDNDKVFIVTKDTNGTKFTATSGKGDWSYVFTKIGFDATANTTVVIEFQGTKDCPVVFKLEGGEAAMTETSVVMTGEAQKVEWSVKPENLTAVGGQMFMFFLNGGVVGCGETPEYIQIKSVKLYRTLEATDEQKAAIYFVANGGTPVDTIYVKAGTAISEPANPTRAGYKFLGWYSDEACTQAFVFDKMPATGAMAYAKWEPDGVKLPDIDLMGGVWNIGTEGTYEVTSTKDVLQIKKTATGAEWDWIGLPMAQVDYASYKTLRVTIKGDAGAQILFKINDAIEKWVTCTGYVQEIELPFDAAIDASKSLIVFANANVKGESGVFEITRLAYGNYDCYLNLIDKTWEGDGKNTFAYENGVLTLSKAADGTDWDHIKVFLPEAVLDGFNVLRVRVQGTAGEEILLKVNDAKEKWVTCTGGVDVVEFFFDLEFDLKKAILVVFANGGKAGTTHEFKLSQIELLSVPNPLDIDLTKGTWVGLDEGVYTINKEYTIAKTPAGGEWNNIAVTLPEVVTLEGINKLLVTVKGTKDEEIMFKVNDQGGELEKKVVCTGEVQVLEFDVALTYDPAKAAMIIFCNPGKGGSGNSFVISKLVYVGAEKSIDLLHANWNVDPSYTFASNVTVSKSTEAGREWSCIRVDVANPNYAGLTKLAVSVKGTAGEKLLLKVNNVLEHWVECTGEVQTLTFDLPASFNLSEAALIVFCNGGEVGTGHDFVIYSAVYTK